MTEQPKISDEAVEAFIADQAIRCGYNADDASSYMRMWRQPDNVERIRAGLAAAYPLLRQQWEAERAEQDGRLSAVVAEAIAREIEARALELRGEPWRSGAVGLDYINGLRDAAEIAGAAGERLSRPNGLEADDA